jgi:hypothetical protein
MPGKIAESSLPQMEKYFNFQKEFFKGFSNGKFQGLHQQIFQRFPSKDFSQIDFKPDK